MVAFLPGSGPTCFMPTSGMGGVLRDELGWGRPCWGVGWTLLDVLRLDQAMLGAQGSAGLIGEGWAGCSLLAGCWSQGSLVSQESLVQVQGSQMEAVGAEVKNWGLSLDGTGFELWLRVF